MSVASISASIKLQLGQFKADIAVAKTEMDKLKQKTDETVNETNKQTNNGSRGFKQWGSDVIDVTRGVNQIGQDLTKHVTVPIMGIGMAAAKTGITFDQKMAEVQAISGATGKDMQALEAKAREMGATTKFSASDAGDAMKYMAMAGWDNSQMIEGIAGIMDLAAASGENLGTTSDIVTDALTAFGMQAGQSGELADVLAAASNNANTNVSLLGESFKYVAPVAGALKYSVNDTAVALGLMANAGIKGSQSGTSLKTMLTNLVRPTKQMRAKMDELGISMENQDGTAKNLKQVMDELRDKFKDLTPEQKAQAAATIFGKEAMSGALAIINASEEDYQKLTKAMAESNGTAKEMADTMSNTTQGKLLEMKSALEECALVIWDSMKPAIEGLIEKVTKAAQAFQKLTPEQQQNIVKWAAIAAAVGPVLLVLTNVILTAKKIYDAFKLMKTAIGLVKGAFVALGGAVSAPMLAVIAVVAAVGLAAYELWKHWDEVTKWISEAWGKLSKWAGEKWGKIKETVTTKVKETVASVKEKWSNLKEATSKKWQEIKETVSNKVSDVKKTVDEKWSGLKESVTGIWTGVKDSVTGKVSEMNNSISEKVGSIKDKTVEKWTGLKEKTSEIFNGIADVTRTVWDGLVNIIDVPLSLIKTIVEAYLTLVKAAFDIAWAAIQLATETAWNFIKEYIVNPIKDAATAVNDKLTELAGWLAEKYQAIADFTSEKWEMIKNFISEKFNAAKDKVVEIATGIHDNISEKWTAVSDFTSEKWNAIKTAVSEKMSAAKEAVSSKASEIHSAISEKWGAVKSKTSEKWSEVKSAISEKMGSAKEAVSTKASEMFSVTSEKFSSIASTARDKFNQAKQNIINPISDAKDKVGEFIQKIKDWFSGLKLKIPKPEMPPMPHFSLRTNSRSVMGKTITYPSGIDVNWYATGGIATGASVVGIGEAGDEAIVPLSNKGRMRPFAEAVASMIDRKDGSGGAGDSDTPIVITGNTLVVREEADIEKIARALYELEQREKRARGKGDK